jgi:5'-3' exonuclease
VAGSEQRVYLVDASIYVFRAYHSIPGTLTNAAGEPVNALHGFAAFLGSLLEEVQPAYMAAVFDESLTGSFRNDIYPAYKANREMPPPDLKRQFAGCRTLVEALGIATYASERFEADDLIGTLAARLRGREFAAVILSADKDLAQLLRPGDLLWDYSRRRYHRYETVVDWLGVHPEQVADWLALAGDAVDNIPGVPGIGPRTAAALLAEFGTLDALFANLGRVGASKLRGAARLQRLLAEHRAAALLSRELAGIAIDPGLQAGVRDVTRRRVSADDVTAACEALGLGRTNTARLLRALK